MKKKTLLKFFAIAIGVFALSSCTKSFCTVQDKANIMEVNRETLTKDINTKAVSSGLITPTTEFNDYIDNKVQAYITSMGDKFPVDSFGKPLEGVARFAGYVEVDNVKTTELKLWYNYDIWYAQAKLDLGLEKVPSTSYYTYFKQSFEAGVAGKITCLTPDSGEYGEGGNLVYVEGKTWGEAFNFGIIEGLLVYPVGWLLHVITNAVGTTGWGQVLAILIVTLIVRALIVLASIRTTISQQKMTLLQPELAKLSAKYPNSDTNQFDKQRLGQEQMALYKKNGIHPFAQIFVMFLQFPVFIAVWGAMQGSAILTQGGILGLSLATTTLNGITAWNGAGSAMAIIFFLMLSISQFFQTKITFWMQDWQTRNVPKLTANAGDSVNKQKNMMKWTSNIMMIFIIIMGLNLPVAMGIYWFFGALISIVQTLVMQAVMAKNKNKKNKKPRKDVKKYERIRR